MKIRFQLFVATLCLLSATAASAASRSGIVPLEVDLSAHEPDKETKLWLPKR